MMMMNNAMLGASSGGQMPGVTSTSEINATSGSGGHDGGIQTIANTHAGGTNLSVTQMSGVDPTSTSGGVGNVLQAAH